MRREFSWHTEAIKEHDVLNSKRSSSRKLSLAYVMFVALNKKGKPSTCGMNEELEKMVSSSSTGSVAKKPMIQRMLRRLGAVEITIVITGLSILFSVVLYMALSSIWEKISVTGVLISVFIPAIVAPLFSYSFSRLLIELDFAERKVRQSEEQYRDIFENVSDFLYFHDLEGHFTKTNIPFKGRYGYSEDDLLNMNVRDLISERYKYQFEDYLRRVIEVGKAEGLMRVVTKDGQERIVEYGNSLVSDTTGPIGVRGSARDITERLEAEKALQRSEERFRNIARLSPFPITIIDSDGQYLYINQKFTEIFGYTLEDVPNGKEWFIKAYPDPTYRKKAVSFWISDLEKSDECEVGPRELRVTCKDETVKDIVFRTVTMEDGKQFITYEDITERKRTEEALRESEEKYRDLVESIDDAIYATDENGIITYVSPAIESTAGYTPSELIGRPFSEFVCEEDLSHAKLRFQRILSREVKPAEYRIRKKSGGICWVCASSRSISKGDRVLGVTGVLRDIDERKRTEQEKARLEKRLLEAQKMEAIGALAGGVAHDLNNMLVGLVSYPELLLMQIPQDSSLRGPVSTIKKSGEKAAAIVQDLLTLARRGVVAPEVVNLNRIISEYLKSPEHEKVEFYHPKVRVETNLEGDPLNILGSPVHLSKTVMNLVSNAAEAMPNGGKIHIVTRVRYLDRPIRGYDDVQEVEYMTLSVSDTGVGISSEDVEKIFEPFYTKKVMGRSGTGLGMTVVWGTVNDHNGYIDVESVEGRGTTFTLYFPVTRQELTKDTSAVSPEDHLGRGESVLIVDDVKEQREIASTIVEKLGYSVKSVSSGEGAVEYLRNGSADLLVLDMIMDPGIDGLETYKRILELYPHQKAILVSGYSETDRVKEAQALGAGTYVRKPYSLEKIGLAIRTELDR